MPKRIPQPRAALEQRLREQLIFWQRSATLYDAGHVEEARRLAVHLRVLLHDSTTSSALLTQLGLKAKLRFRQSGYPREPRNLASWAGLTVIQNGPRAGFAPLLDEEPLPGRRSVMFGEWWSTVVIVDQRKAGGMDAAP